MNFFKETFRRLVLKTPSYFKKLIYFGIALGTIGTGLMTIPELEQFYVIGEKLFIIGLVCGVISKTAVTDPNRI
jgi:uncharacterized membrane protein YhhN